MNDMVLRPSPGIDDAKTMVTSNPWLERKKRGFLRGWFATLGMALIAPGKLMRGTPPERSTATAWWFALLTGLLVYCVGIVPLLIMPAIILGAGKPRSGGLSSAMMGMTAGAAGFALFLSVVGLLWIFMWGGITHFVMWVSGGTQHGPTRTYAALCYTSGANAASAVPFLGWYLGWIWWIIASILAVKEAQRVHGGRAAIAVLTLPAIAIVCVVSLYIALLVPFAMQAVATSPAFTDTSMESLPIQTAILNYADAHNGNAPDHVLQLLLDGSVGAKDVFISEPLPTETMATDYPALHAFLSAPPKERQAVAERLMAKVPPNAAEYRFGEFVFTHRGVNVKTADPGVWLVVLPSKAPTTTDHEPEIVVALSDSSVQRFPGSQLERRLTRQNKLRERDRLPALTLSSLLSGDSAADDPPEKQP